MSHPKETVEVGGVGSQIQEQRDRPGSSETKAGTSQDSRREDSLTEQHGGDLGRVLGHTAGSRREDIVHSGLWPPVKRPRFVLTVWEARVTYPQTYWSDHTTQAKGREKWAQGRSWTSGEWAQ